MQVTYQNAHERRKLRSVSTSCSALLDLPSELKLHICFHLTARDIVRLRLVNRTLIDIVKDNVQHIYSLAHSRELTRLRKVINYYVTYEGDVSFLEAFSRWARLRGWADMSVHTGHNTSGIANEDSIRKFSKHWTPLKNYPDLSTTAHNDTFHVAHRLWSQHEYFHGDVSELDDTAGVFELDTFTKLIKAYARRNSGFTDVECIAMYNVLKDTPGGRLSGPHREAYDIPGPPPGVFGFTPGTFGLLRDTAFTNAVYTTGTKQNRLFWTPISLFTNEWASIEELLETFGIPELPTNQFAYVVKSDWACRTVHKILHVHGEGLEVGPLMMAAGMEELRIY